MIPISEPLVVAEFGFLFGRLVELILVTGE